MTTPRTITTPAELDAWQQAADGDGYLVTSEGDAWLVYCGEDGDLWALRPPTEGESDATGVSRAFEDLALPIVILAAAVPGRDDPTVTVVSDAAVEAAARALADDWNPDRDPVLTAMFRDYAATAVTAALPFLGAAPSVEHIARTLAETTALTGADAHLIVQAAQAMSAPSATREDVARSIDPASFDFPEECAGEIKQALQAAGDLLALFTITPRTDR